MWLLSSRWLISTNETKWEECTRFLENYKKWLKKFVVYPSTRSLNQMRKNYNWGIDRKREPGHYDWTLAAPCKGPRNHARSLSNGTDSVAQHLPGSRLLWPLRSDCHYGTDDSEPPQFQGPASEDYAETYEQPSSPTTCEGRTHQYWLGQLA